MARKPTTEVCGRCRNSEFIGGSAGCFCYKIVNCVCCLDFCTDNFEPEVPAYCEEEHGRKCCEECPVFEGVVGRLEHGNRNHDWTGWIGELKKHLDAGEVEGQ